MKVHVLVYTDTNVGFEATNAHVYLTEKEAADAMVESIRKFYPNYKCTDDLDDSTNIVGLHVGCSYAYDIAYEHNWNIIETELSNKSVIYGMIVSEIHRQYLGLSEAFDDTLIKVIERYDNEMACIEKSIDNGVSVDSLVQDIIGSSLYHAAMENLSFDSDDMDDVVDYLNTEESFIEVIPNASGDTTSTQWLATMLRLVENEPYAVKSVQAELDKMFNPYKDLNLQDGFRELCKTLNNEEYNCLLEEIKKAREIKVYCSYPSHQAALQDLCNGMRKRFFEIVSEKGWDWVEEHFSFRWDIKFEKSLICGEKIISLNWYCGDDDFAYGLDGLEQALENN